MTRIVLDTNILVSATIVKEGAPAQILQTWRQGEVELATSPTLLNEFAEVVSRPRIQKYQWMSEAEITELQSELGKSAIQGSGERIVTVIKEGPDDDYVLSAALETKADYIVSGDPHLVSLEEYQGIQIAKPAALLEIIQSAEEPEQEERNNNPI